MQISSSNLLHIQSEPTISEIKFVLQISSSLDNFAKPMTEHQRFAVYTILIPDIHTYIYTIWQLFTKAERGTRMTQLPPLPACLLGLKQKALSAQPNKPTSTITAPARFRCQP
jgi:hypothetical protein